MIDALYSRDILKRTTELLHIGHLTAPQGMADGHAKLCGSKVHIEVCICEGVVTDFAMQVKACALGQAAAAILSQKVLGAPLSDIIAAHEALKGLLAGETVTFPERFSDMAILQSVKDFPARHASTLLALETTVKAIEAAQNQDKN